MQQEVATKKRIREGDKVRIHTRLRSGMEFSRVSVWVREKEDLPFSPYVDPETGAALDKGKPAYNRPFHKRLTIEHTPAHTFEFTAYADMDVQLRQTVDSLSDPKPRARIKRYGKTAQSIRQRCRDFVRAARNYFAFFRKDSAQDRR